MYHYVILEGTIEILILFDSEWGAQHGRRRIITFEFGKHNDTYFGNLEGHGSPNLLKMKLYISGFWRKRCTGCPKKISNNEMSVFLT